MTRRRTLITAQRILTQLKHDPRTIGLVLAVPAGLVGLLAWSLLHRPGQFNALGPRLLGVFPLTVMFLVTSVTTLRERTSGTLERLLTLPVAKGDIIGGYAVAFSLVAMVQSALVALLSYTVFGLHHVGIPWRSSLVALLSGLLGTAFGLALSALATSEFQAVQFMPAFILPQLLLSGLFVPLGDLPLGLRQVADVLPMSAAIRALQPNETVSGALLQSAVMLGYIGAALCVGALTLRRRQP
ncbi:MAG: ABC transporter permease [Acidimicrobiaceae bacterium]|nr:ABC transporter permease [Acidimicrobiaceae bacterium]